MGQHREVEVRLQTRQGELDPAAFSRLRPFVDQIYKGMKEAETPADFEHKLILLQMLQFAIKTLRQPNRKHLKHQVMAGSMLETEVIDGPDFERAWRQAGHDYVVAVRNFGGSGTI